ncbi:putative fimbrial chaperone YcbF [Klebsiella pneumoniae]|nr:putative fimbrial chaperone YcbF [Klebsiella pneumoniae]SAV05175.1 chaperone protein fimC [Klebsiella pneumoniae]
MRGSLRAWQQLKFSQSGGRLTVINPTPYFVSFYAVEVGGQSIDDPGMVAPFGEKTWPVSGHGTVKWRAINDYGGVSDFAQQ